METWYWTTVSLHCSPLSASIMGNRGMYLLQTSTSVRMALRIVLRTHNVLILKVATLVHVHWGTVEMEPSVMVSMTLCIS